MAEGEEETSEVVAYGLEQDPNSLCEIRQPKMAQWRILMLKSCMKHGSDLSMSFYLYYSCFRWINHKSLNKSIEQRK